MPGWIKRLLGNLALTAGAILITFAFLEVVVFGFIFVPSDVLHNVTINQVVRYQPGSTPTFRHPDGRKTHLTINADGWNSTKPEYVRDKIPGVLRVAVVGDSYVHGAFINTDQGFPEVLERELNAAGKKVEVYRFGMDGAPMSQYLWMLRKEVINYHPDVVVVQLIHNDFDESYRFMGTRYNSSFMKIGTDAVGNPKEIAPEDFRPGWPDTLRELKTFRYLYYSTNMYLRIKSLVTRYVWGSKEDYAPEFISSAVDVRNIADHDKIRWVTRYVMGEIRKLADEQGFKLMFSMDGVREAIYDGKPVASYPVGFLNQVSGETAAELKVPFLDLQDTFAKDYAVNKQRLEFPYDWHWNEHANELVGKAIAARLLAEPAMLTPAESKKVTSLQDGATAQ